MMMQAHIAGGIPALFNEHPDTPPRYPQQGWEWAGELTHENVTGKVVKRFNDSLIKDFPKDLGNLHVVYMLRDQDARRLAAPTADHSYDYRARHEQQIRNIKLDTRVTSLVVLDYDDTVDYPLEKMLLLAKHGWEINCAAATKIIDPGMRHERRL